MLFLLLSHALAQDPVPADPFVAELQSWLVAQGAPAEEAPAIAAGIMQYEASLPWQTGEISLRDGAITLSLAPGDRYVGPEATSQILERWGNPPDPHTDGLLLPGGTHLFGPGAWAVLVQFQPDGWVDDSDAASIDYDELLVAMQEGQEQGNAERKRLGLEGLHITGWAESPRYDASSHVLYWATLLQTDLGATTLNYDVRVLGRKGVLSLNALAAQEDLPRIKPAMERVRALARFNEGHRYADYVPGADAKAAYGLAALVAGGAVAAKSGLLKGLLAVLLASKKLLVVGVLALVGVGRGLWSALTGSGRD